MGGLPPVFVEFLGKSTGVKTAMRDIKSELKTTEAEGTTGFQRFGKLGTAAVAGIGLAAAGVAVESVKMAADFQTQMTRVQTGAGESAKNIKMVGDGVLAMAGEVGQSTTQLTSGLYLVESAGYHGANALNVLKTAAMGAKVGAADLGTTSDALTTAMNAYGISAKNSTQVMNALIATEGEGKTNLEALAGSMSKILPTAAAAHVGLTEVLGAMATMTAQGTSADVAATYLRQTIGNLSNPTGKAAQEMKSLGLSSVQVSQNLGKNGLASTLNELTTAIQSKMGPAGTVLIQHLQAASKNTSAFQKVLANLPPAQQTYIGALATMVGGTKSMQAALELTGGHMKTFQANVRGIADHVKKGGNAIEGWAEVQKTFNQRLAEAKGGAQALMIQLGNALLPTVTKLMGVLAAAASWLTKHKTVAEGLAIVVGIVLVTAIGAATVALWGFITTGAVLEALPWVAAISAIIIVIVLLATHWKQVWGLIKSVALDVWHALEAAWKAIESVTVSVWHAITSAVVTAWHAVASFFASSYHAVVDPIVAAWRWIAGITTAVWNAISGFFRKWWPLLMVIFMPFVAGIMALWNHFHKQIESTAKTVWNAIKAFFGVIWNGIKAIAGAVWAGIKVAIIQPIEDVWAGMKALWHLIAPYLSAAWNGIKSAASAIWGFIKQAMINPITEAWHAITHVIGSIASSIWSGLVSAWHAVEHVGSWFLGIGSSIVEGIIHGVENAAGSLFSSLKNLASGALDAAKSFLGINSPSKLFANVVGVAIPEGVAKGVDDHAHLAHNAVRRMASGIPTTGALSGGLGIATPAAAGFGPASASGGGVTVNLTVQGHVLTERDLRDLIEEQFLRLGGRNSATWASYRK